MNKKNVTILTGFLGAGKTTFLNHLINSNRNTRYALIINEFGEIGIDGELIFNQDDTIVELNNGCLCCTLNDNLYDILNELHEIRDQFDEIIIESTGVADPAGLAQPFISHPLIKKHFPLKATVCLIDAELIEDHLEETEEAINQVTFSDILLLNKTDLVSEKYAGELVSTLHKLNPLATIYEGNKETFPKLKYGELSEKLIEIRDHAYHHHEHQHNQSHQNIHSVDKVLSFPVSKPPHHHHHEHTESVNSISFVFDRPFDFGKLHLQLSVYLTFQSKDLYRFKGLIWLKGEDKQYILQSVGKRLDFTEKGDWQQDQIKQSIIVFIGKNLQRSGIERVLQNCLVKE